jgi:hypothetical protein
VKVRPSTALDLDEAFLLQPEKELHQEERATLRTLSKLEQAGAGRCPHDIAGDLLDGFLPERPQHEPPRADPLQIVQRGREVGRCGPATLDLRPYPAPAGAPPLEGYIKLDVSATSSPRTSRASRHERWRSPSDPARS